MKAKDLKPGQIFTVDTPDPESPVRVCKTNDPDNGLRFGFPNNPRYWCSMGGECEVTVQHKCDECGKTGAEKEQAITEAKEGQFCEDCLELIQDLRTER